ncbi:MAG: ABC transporter ATP-binding protein [Actinomycetota bacterium]|nr:ABC transporter ATP-binding protein [Actinomycetota bacterium]
MADLAISAHNVSKKFVVHSERATSIKERIVKRKSSHRTFDALHNVSLEIEAGTTVGLIGANGSGKSTLLKVLAGILRPNSGEVVTRGRIASLLELGAGFNGELSGRENVYLNASLLGLSRRETEGLFDEILAFSELEEFIDNPVKHYSSGMYVRLGFAVAVHVDPDILLIDEVLAVGDEHFARKCLDKIAQFQDEGRTILFVTHGLDLVERICDRGVVLDHGNMVFDGDPYFASGALRKILRTDLPSDVPDDLPEDTGVAFGEVTFSDAVGGPARTEIQPGMPLAIRVELDLSQYWAGQVDQLQVVVMGVGNVPIWSMIAEKTDLPQIGGHWKVDFIVPHCPPMGGRFVVGAQLLREDGQPIAAHQTRNAFDVDPGHKVGLLKVDYHCGAMQGVTA